MRVLRLGTRASALARWQTDHVASRLKAAHPKIVLEIVTIESEGDAFPETLLADMEGQGFFTSALERALLADDVDIAVHSYKDLPVLTSRELVVAAVPERAPVEDVLCAKAGVRLSDLPRGARVGTSSLRRRAQLRALRPDLDFRDLRGNVPTRLSRVGRGELDAVVLARAGLERLGLMGQATELLALDLVLPAPAQGALAVQARLDDGEARGALAALENPEARRAVEAERAVLHALGGGCSLPVGAWARADGPRLELDAGVFDPDTGRGLRVAVQGDPPRALGAEAARQLLERGARAILAACAKEPRVPERTVE
jgi:hydroxymethylbilane synthase